MTRSDLAALAGKVPPSPKSLQQLGINSDFLDHLNTNWQLYHSAGKLPPHRFVVGSDDLIVPPSNGRGRWDESVLETIPKANHFNIVKPPDTTHLSFIVAKNFLLEVLGLAAGSTLVVPLDTSDDEALSVELKVPRKPADDGEKPSKPEEDVTRDGEKLLRKLTKRIADHLAGSPSAMAVLHKALFPSETSAAPLPSQDASDLTEKIMGQGFVDVLRALRKAREELKEKDDPQGEEVVRKVSRLLLPFLYAKFSVKEKDRKTWAFKGTLGDVLPIPAGIRSMAELVMAGLDHREVDWAAKSRFPHGKNMIDMSHLPEGGIRTEATDLNTLRNELFKHHVEVPVEVLDKEVSSQDKDKSINIELKHMFKVNEVRLYLVCGMPSRDQDAQDYLKRRNKLLVDTYPLLAVLELAGDLHDDEKLFNELRELLVTP